MRSDTYRNRPVNNQTQYAFSGMSQASRPSTKEVVTQQNIQGTDAQSFGEGWIATPIITKQSEAKPPKGVTLWPHENPALMRKYCDWEERERSRHQEKHRERYQILKENQHNGLRLSEENQRGMSSSSRRPLRVMYSTLKSECIKQADLKHWGICKDPMTVPKGNLVAFGEVFEYSKFDLPRKRVTLGHLLKKKLQPFVHEETDSNTNSYKLLENKSPFTTDSELTGAFDTGYDDDYSDFLLLCSSKNLFCEGRARSKQEADREEHSKIHTQAKISVMTPEHSHPSELDKLEHILPGFKDIPELAQLVDRRFRVFSGERYCLQCHSAGHEEPSCPDRFTQICRYCLENHLADYCTQIVCADCNEIGHRAEQCCRKKSERFPRCNWCSRRSHRERDCQVLHGDFSRVRPKLQKVLCFMCGTTSHSPARHYQQQDRKPLSPVEDDSTEVESKGSISPKDQPISGL